MTVPFNRGGVPLLGIIAMLVVGRSSTQAQPLQWSPHRPPERSGAEMVYDSVRGVSVLFGGIPSLNWPSSYLGDTWEWNGSTWVRRAVSGPVTRHSSGMAFDPIRRVIVLFGGGTAIPFDDTWEWDGATWEQRSPTNRPLARESAAMAFDESRGRTILYGGWTGFQTGITYTDTWEWDGDDWSQVATAGPLMLYPNLAYDRSRNVMTLLGYTSNGQVRAYEWTGQSWASRPLPATLSQRQLFAATYDDVRGTVVFHGGGRSNVMVWNETWDWDGSLWTLRPMTPALPRWAHNLVYDSSRNRLVVFGGRSDLTGNRLSDTWEADDVGWTEKCPSPPSRELHAMTSSGLLFGGRTPANVRLADTWQWDGVGWTRQLVPAPSARFGHAMAYDSDRQLSFLFGGDAASGASAETWEWGENGWMNRTSPGPQARSLHAMVYDSLRRVLVLFGGRAANGTRLSDIWEWSGSTWTQIPATGPSGRVQHGMAYDSNRQVTVLFGGIIGSARSQETWEWDGAVWTLRATTGPAARSGHGMAYDSTRQMTIVFSGAVADTTASIDMWAWDGQVWTQLPLTGPTPRLSAVMTFDPLRGETLLFGGEYRDSSIEPVHGILWRLGVPCAAPAIDFVGGNETRCAGGSMTLTLTATGDDPITFRWRRDGVDLADEPDHISGAATATLTIINTTLADAGQYDCLVSNACGTVVSDPAALHVCDHLADLTCDGEVGISDLSTLLSNFGRVDAPTRADGDLDADGAVGLADLALLLAAFGAACP